MIQRIIILIALGLLTAICGCAVHESTAEQAFCTIEDQEAGTCTLSITTNHYADSVEQMEPEAPIDRTGASCGKYPDGRKWCRVELSFPSFTVVAVCEQHYGAIGQPDTVECGSWSY